MLFSLRYELVFYVMQDMEIIDIVSVYISLVAVSVLITSYPDPIPVQAPELSTS